jgi:hypothetical protein
MDDFDLQQRQLEQRRMMANQLRQTEIPQGRMVGRIFVKQPGEAIAAALRQYAGMSELKDVDKASQDLSQRKQQIEQGDLQKFAQALRGTPEMVNAPATPMDDEGNVMPTTTTAAQKGDPYAAYTGLSASQIPALRQAGLQGLSQFPQMEARQAEREADRQFRMQQAEAQRQARADQIAQQQEFQREMKRMGGAGAQPYFQPVQTAQGVMAFNARTGQMEPIQAGGRSVLGAQYDPSLQGELMRSKEGAKAGVELGVEKGKAVRKADQMIGQLDQAEKLLKEKPTASGVGSALDTAGRAIGVTSKGAQTAAQLEALSGWLVANVPRMEGPQSNFDVQNYQTMAGKIGDRTVPVAEREAALKEVKRLQQKYKEINQEPVAQPSAAPAQGRVRRFNPATGAIE